MAKLTPEQFPTPPNGFVVVEADNYGTDPRDYVVLCRRSSDEQWATWKTAPGKCDGYYWGHYYPYFSYGDKAESEARRDFAARVRGE